MAGAFTQWLASDIGKAAERYIDDGYYVFPLHGVSLGLRCTCGKDPHGESNKNAGKHPFTRNGLNDASNDIRQVAAMFQYREDLNIAIRTGIISGFWILDIDDNKGGDKSLGELKAKYGKLPITKVSFTGNGYHVWFRCIDGVPIKNGTNVFGLEFPGIDARGEGGYIVAPPSRHFSGRTYKCPEENNVGLTPAPSWLRELIVKPVEKPQQNPTGDRTATSGAQSEWSEGDVLDMLSCINPDAAYDDWLHVGMALHHGGFPMGMWDDWSARGSKYVVNECAKKWNGFVVGSNAITMGTLVDMAQNHGWKPKPIYREPVDTSAVDEAVKVLSFPIETKKPEITLVQKRIATVRKLPFDPTEIDGLIGDTVRWILSTAMFKQPDLALLNTLAFAGAVFGRIYSSPVNTRTNLYTVGIGPTGSGKDHSRKMITHLSTEAKLSHFLGGNALRSDTGVLRSMTNSPSQLMMLDEFGKIIRATGDAKSPYHIQMISRLMLTLYSDSGSTYNHGDYADPKSKPIIIRNPNLCIFGTDTENGYVPALRKSAIENGELNRFVVLPAERNRKYPPKNIPKMELDSKLLEHWKLFSKENAMFSASIVDLVDVAPDPIEVFWGECEDLQYEISCAQTDMLNDEGNQYKSLWGRYYENTVKIAMIFAIARNRTQPSMIENDFYYAKSIVESSIEYVTSLACHQMAENDYEENQNKVRRTLASSGGEMTRRDLMRKCGSIRKKELEEIISLMIDQEMVIAEKHESARGGRHVISYKLTM